MIIEEIIGVICLAILTGLLGYLYGKGREDSVKAMHRRFKLQDELKETKNDLETETERNKVLQDRITNKDKEIKALDNLIYSLMEKSDTAYCKVEFLPVESDKYYSVRRRHFRVNLKENEWLNESDNDE